MKVYPLISIAISLCLLASCDQNTSPTALPAISTLTNVIPINTPDPTIKTKENIFMYSQDFEDGTTEGLYDFGMGKWEILIDAADNHVYCNVPSDEGLDVHFGAYEWGNYAVSMKIKELKKGPEPYFSIYARFERYQYLMYYGALNFETQMASLSYNDPYQPLGQKYFPLKDNNWYTLRLELAGNHISFFVDDTAIASVDNGSRSEGKAGFGIPPQLKICVDDILVWSLTKDGQIAQPSETTMLPPVDLEDRLASHKFPKLIYMNQDSDPKSEALIYAYMYDILLFDRETLRSEWIYLGPEGIIRSKNPNSVILAMHSVQEFYPDDGSTTGKEYVSGIKPEWVMQDINGQPFPAFDYGNGYWSTMPNLSTEINSYIPQFLNQKIMRYGMFDGIYYDGTNESWWQANNDDNIPGGPIDSNRDGKPDTTEELNEAINSGLQGLLIETRNKLPDSYIITGNGGWNGSLLLEENPKADTVLANLLNGRMIEGFLNWEKYGINWLESMRAYYLMQEVSVEPKTPLILAYCTGADHDHLRYVLASSLMFDAYFTCTDSQDGSLSHPYTSNWWYDEYSVDLSTGTADKSLHTRGYLELPSTESYNVDDPNEMLSALLIENNPKALQITWRRDFENGIALVNPSNTTKTVNLKGAYRKILGIYNPAFNDGATITEITLPPKSGVILPDP